MYIEEESGTKEERRYPRRAPRAVHVLPGGPRAVLAGEQPPVHGAAVVHELSNGEGGKRGKRKWSGYAIDYYTYPPVGTEMQACKP